jgi:hypothetical protein
MKKKLKKKIVLQKNKLKKNYKKMQKIKIKTFQS